MKCINCGFNPEEWKEVTKDCKIRIAETSTEEKLNYLILEHNGIDLGCISRDESGFTSYEKDNIFSGRKYPEMYEYRFMGIQTKGNLKSYFKIMVRKIK